MSQRGPLVNLLDLAHRIETRQKKWVVLSEWETADVVSALRDIEGLRRDRRELVEALKNLREHFRDMQRLTGSTAGRFNAADARVGALLARLGEGS